MFCCKAPAIPKTSQNYLQFFAHYSDECDSSPESQWHLATKEAVFKELLKLNLKAEIEKTGGHKGMMWQADVFFQHAGRKFAIEIQHSYQHLIDYLARQERYVESGVEAYWILYHPRYLTLTHSLVRYRLKHEFGNKFPEGGLFPGIPTLPVVYYDLSNNQGMVKGANFFQATLLNWIESIISGKFECRGGVWNIS